MLFPPTYTEPALVRNYRQWRESKVTDSTAIYRKASIHSESFSMHHDPNWFETMVETHVHKLHFACYSQQSAFQPLHGHSN